MHSVNTLLLSANKYGSLSVLVTTVLPVVRPLRMLLSIVCAMFNFLILFRDGDGCIGADSMFSSCDALRAAVFVSFVFQTFQPFLIMRSIHLSSSGVAIFWKALVPLIVALRRSCRG